MTTTPSPRRRLPAVQTIDALGRPGLTLVWDEWSEETRAFVPPTDGVPWAGSVRSLPGFDRFDLGRVIARDHLVGEIIDPVLVVPPVQEGDHGAFRTLPALRDAPFLAEGVFGRRPNVAASLAGNARSIRAGVIEALIGGVTGDDGVLRAEIGESEIAVEARSGAWEILGPDGHVTTGSTLRGFACGLGGVGDGAFAVRLIEAVLGWRLPIRVALTIADAIDGAPKPRMVGP